MTITNIFPSTWRLSAVAAAAVRCLNTVSDTAVQDTVAAFDILRPKRWLRQFFVGCSSSAGDGGGSIKDDVAVPLSGTLSTFSYQLCLILSYRVSTAVVLVFPHILFPNYPPFISLFPIYFFVPIVSPRCYCLNLPASTPLYLLPSLSTVPFI